jgi:hypothetical protein
MNKKLETTWKNVLELLLSGALLDLPEVLVITAPDHRQDSQFPSRDANLPPFE